MGSANCIGGGVEAVLKRVDIPGAAPFARVTDLVSWRTPLYVLAAGLLLYSYQGLLAIGTRYGFAKGVEYWLFRPHDSAPFVIMVLSGWLLYRRLPRLSELPASSGPWWGIALCLGLGEGILLWSVHTTAPDLLVASFAFNCVEYLS